ncbi:hypothetical protein PHYBOEH_007849 [Phytophthora boehmeriae]|uniref:Uncharacterized protein n=1 Tax=Phytophthora boehmeriae TaxID=109152 RepID=A0A8T1W4E5_9STRA|nr:hypothetical protein PHYBOEH_007849 [Phytophthora boehmeriae]
MRLVAKPNLRASVFTVKDGNTKSDVLVVINAQNATDDSEVPTTNFSKLFEFAQTDLGSSSSASEEEERALISPAFRDALKTAIKHPVKFAKSFTFIQWFKKVLRPRHP